MNTLVCLEPGKFGYRQSEMPSVGDGESLIKIKRIGICGTDLHAFEGTQPYFNYPRILGHELAGDIVSTDNPQFDDGEPATIIPYFSCGHCKACMSGRTNCCTSLNVCGVHIDGGMVEYLKVPSDKLIKSHGLKYDQLALVEPLAIGAHALRRGYVKKSDTILVIGAGPIGLGIMILGKIIGARVIGMDINPSRQQFCNQVIKIDEFVNPSDGSALERISDLTQGNMPDVVFDASGSLNAINGGFEYLSHGGKYVLVGLQKNNITFSHPAFHKREATLMSSRNATVEDFNFVISAIQRNEFDVRSLITHTVPFSDLADKFPGFLNPASGVIKAMAHL